MRPDERDAAYLWDMLDAARTVRQIVAGVDRDDYLQNRTLQLAVERGLELVGEAARRVSEEFKANHADIPWRSIVAQRNVIAHEYGAINHMRLWALVVNGIPELVAKLDALLPPERD